MQAVPKISGSTDWGQWWGWFHVRHLDPMHMEIKLHVLTCCLCSLAPNRPRPGTSLQTKGWGPLHYHIKYVYPYIPVYIGQSWIGSKYLSMCTHTHTILLYKLL